VRNAEKSTRRGQHIFLLAFCDAHTERNCTLSSPVDQIPGPSPEDPKRIHNALSQVTGIYAPSLGDRDILEVWLLEQRMKAERLASQRLARATWALAAVTVALVVATVALVIATFQL
jgi:hypothetical protein